MSKFLCDAMEMSSFFVDTATKDIMVFSGDPKGIEKISEELGQCNTTVCVPCSL